MSSTLKKLSKWVVRSPYLSRWVVLAIDSIASMLASLLVYVVIAFFIRSSAPGSAYLIIALVSFLVSAIVFVFFGTYRGIMRHTTMQEVSRIFVSLIAKSLVLYVIFSSFSKYFGMTLNSSKIMVAQFSDIVCSLFILVTLRVILIYVYELFLHSININTKKVLIYGADNKSLALANYLTKNTNSEYRVLGFVKVDDNISKLTLQGIPLYTVDSGVYFSKLIQKLGVNALIFSSQAAALQEKDRLIEYCVNEDIKVMLLPQLSELSSGSGITAQIREIKIEDLLGREEIKINMAEIKSFLNNKVVLVTGGAGSIGSELCRLVSSFDIKQLIVLDNAETPLHNIQLEISDTEKAKHLGAFNLESFNKKYKFVIADVRVRARIDKIFEYYKPDIVFHAAAYKHVPMMEANPCEAVNVNVGGTKIVAECAVKYNAEKMIMVSTDKAVNPTNVMGCTKRLAEIYVQTLSKAIIAGELEGKTKFITTRFGNVLGSNGSVIPRFREQIMNGGPVTVTHKDIIRFFMTIPEACRLVLEAATMGKGYEIFVFDMGEPVKIADLARKMISLAGFRPDIDIKIEYSGLRPGEKLYEEVLNSKECCIATEHKKISVAKVRDYNYAEIIKDFNLLKESAEQMNKMETVKNMKYIVPEFISKNSVYSALDNNNNTAC